MEHKEIVEVLKDILEHSKKDIPFHKKREGVTEALTLALEKLENPAYIIEKGKITKDDLRSYQAMQHENTTLKAELALLKGKIDSLKKVLDSPERWMKWCDIKVLEENEELKKELALLKKKVEKDCKYCDVEDCPCRNGRR